MRKHTVGLKKVGIDNGIRKGEWQIVREGTPPGKPKKLSDRGKGHDPLAMSPEEHLSMVHDKAAGMTDKDIAEKYAVTAGFVNAALRKQYVNNTTGREILKGLLLDNAIAVGSKAATQIDELEPMQSMAATKLMTNAFIDLDKHSQSSPAVVDFTELAKMGEQLKGLNDLVTDLPTDTEGIIDITASVKRVKG